MFQFRMEQAVPMEKPREEICKEAARSSMAPREAVPRSSIKPNSVGRSQQLESSRSRPGNPVQLASQSSSREASSNSRVKLNSSIVSSSAATGISKSTSIRHNEMPQQRKVRVQKRHLLQTLATPTKSQTTTSGGSIEATAQSQLTKPPQETGSGLDASRRSISNCKIHGQDKRYDLVLPESLVIPETQPTLSSKLQIEGPASLLMSHQQQQQLANPGSPSIGQQSIQVANIDGRSVILSGLSLGSSSGKQPASIDSSITQTGNCAIHSKQTAQQQRQIPNLGALKNGPSSTSNNNNNNMSCKPAMKSSTSAFDLLKPTFCNAQFSNRNSQLGNLKLSSQSQSSLVAQLDPSSRIGSNVNLINSTNSNSNNNNNHNHRHPQQQSMTIKRKVNLKYIKAAIILLLAIDLAITIFVHHFAQNDVIGPLPWFTSSLKVRFSQLNLILSSIWFSIILAGIIFDLYPILCLACLIDLISFLTLIGYTIVHFSRRLDYQSVSLSSLLGLLFSIIVLHVYLLVTGLLTAYLAIQVRRRNRQVRSSL